MGPEVIAAIVGPMFGGAISLGLWLNKKNTERIEYGFEKYGDGIERVERCLNEVRLDIAKNYVTNDDLLLHIKGEEEWHNSIDRRIDSLGHEVSSLKNSLDRIHFGEDPRG